MKLIGITGYARSGKDTIGEILVREHHYVRFAFADPIKEMIQAMLEMSADDLEACKDEVLQDLGVTPRHLMQTLGTEWGRDTIDKELWINLLKRKIILQADLHPEKNIVVTDVRFPEEAEMIRSLGGSIWKVRRDLPGLEDCAHESESYIDTYEVDEELINVTGDKSVLQAQATMYHFDTPHLKHLPE